MSGGGMQGPTRGGWRPPQNNMGMPKMDQPMRHPGTGMRFGPPGMNIPQPSMPEGMQSTMRFSALPYSEANVPGTGGMESNPFARPQVPSFDLQSAQNQLSRNYSPQLRDQIRQAQFAQMSKQWTPPGGGTPGPGTPPPPGPVGPPPGPPPGIPPAPPPQGPPQTPGFPPPNQPNRPPIPPQPTGPMQLGQTGWMLDGGFGNSGNRWAPQFSPQATRYLQSIMMGAQRQRPDGSTYMDMGVRAPWANDLDPNNMMGSAGLFSGQQFNPNDPRWG